MITRHDLQTLQSLSHIPALSILLPTHRTFPDNKQDPILVKNLVDEARVRLSAEFSTRELEPLFTRLERLVNDIDYQYALDGLALFVSHELAQKYYLPFSVPTRVVIDKTFATRDLVYGMNRAQQFWVLLLSQSSTRLIVGTGETLEEVHDRNFPMPMTGPGGTTALPYEADSSYLDDRHRRFFQQVDQCLKSYISNEEEVPLILGGVDRQMSFFKEVSCYTSAIAGMLSGNFDKASLAELTPLVLPIMHSVRQTQRSHALQLLDEAMGAQRVVSTIEEVWQLAQEGRGQVLLTEKNYHVPAMLTVQGGLQVVEHPGGTDVMDDAIDEVIEVVLAKGGRVVMVEDGALTAHQRIALILRY